MTDVDSIRWMASEHDLEFVDLDNYGVDPAAGEILPEELARRHHMVAIKRKFGTPVIATADPDDLYAQDSVRASIGRDFISVIASPEQIGAYIDRLFGADPASSPPVAEVVAPGPAPIDVFADSGVNFEVNRYVADQPIVADSNGAVSDEVQVTDILAGVEPSAEAAEAAEAARSRRSRRSRHSTRLGGRTTGDGRRARRAFGNDRRQGAAEQGGSQTPEGHRRRRRGHRIRT